MQSFPSSFTRNKLADNTLSKLLGSDVTSTLKNAGKALIGGLAATFGSNSGVTVETIKDGFDFDTNRDYELNTNVNKLNISNTSFNNGNYRIPLTTSISDNETLANRIYSMNLSTINGSYSIYENAFKMPAEALATINKYRYIYKYAGVNSVVQFSGKTSKEKDAKEQHQRSTTSSGISPSLFNPWYGIPWYGFGTSYTTNSGKFPLYVPIYIDGNPVEYVLNNTSHIKPKIAAMDKDGNHNEAKDKPIEFDINMSNNRTVDVNDCSIKTLVALSGDENKPLGRNVYKYSDFMYCKDLGKVSNNHLITLRRFPEPVGDNINEISHGSYTMILPDKGRLITWFGTEDNKLEDICKYHYNMGWEPKESDVMDRNSKEEQYGDKLFPSIANILSENYRNLYNDGKVQGNNKFIHYFIGDSVGQYANDGDVWARDPNKIYEPKNTIQKTHIYKGNLEFEQNITLKFSYSLRYYSGINPKSAFLDLIGNILEVTYKRGGFWGGQNRWLGPSPNNAVWKQLNTFMDDAQMETDKFLGQILSAGSFDSILSTLSNAISGMGDFLSNVAEKAGNTIATEITKIRTTEDDSLLHKTVGMVFGNLKNKLGRPAIYSAKTLLTGDPVGFWHLTVGNPRNPILSIGNLILTGADIQHSGPLGIDDFPTEITVTVNLKHGRPRDITEISQMYTMASHGIYTQLATSNLSLYYGEKLENNKHYTGVYKDEFSDEKKRKAFGNLL